MSNGARRISLAEKSMPASDTQLAGFFPAVPASDRRRQPLDIGVMPSKNPPWNCHGASVARCISHARPSRTKISNLKSQISNLKSQIPITTMHDLPRQKLSELLGKHGHGLCDDPGLNCLGSEPAFDFDFPKGAMPCVL